MASLTISKLTKLFVGCIIVSLLLANFFNLQNIIPDYFRCSDGCNTCHFRIRKIGSFNIIINEGCTEVFCLEEASEAELEVFRKFSNNWLLDEVVHGGNPQDHTSSLYSRSIGYDRLFVFANNCVNGYRNFTYVERKQEENPDFSSSDLQTLEYTREALTEGITACEDLESFLRSEANFTQEQIGKFGVYLRPRSFTNPYDYVHTVRGMLESIENQKLIFDYLSENSHKFSNLVTSKMINEFAASYAGYLEDKAKYGEETFEQRRDRLFDRQQF